MHRVQFHRRAAKALRNLPADRQSQILQAIQDLAATPDPAVHHNVKAMKGQWEGRYRLRVGDYRVIFILLPDETGLTIFVTDIGPRGGIYG
jgi:mRNA interferase RelE/StbE